MTSHFKLKFLVIPIILIIAVPSFNYSQCTGLNVNAGADIFVCDPTQIIQLQGSVQGNYSKLYWTPVNGLSSSTILDPIVTNKIPGKYTYKLTAEGLSTVNLVVNGDFESGNSGFQTAYTYNTINITEGEYFVGAFPETWNGGFSPCRDHTTGSGNMLLVNGHPVAGTNFWCETFATVVGRMYQFEFWSQSLVSQNIGQFSVKVNGTTIGSTSAGPLCNWVQYIVSFTATSTSSQICINETTGIRAGNDFALDDIALYEKCVVMDDVNVEIVNLVAKIDIPFKPKCSSDAFDLSAIGSSAGANITYTWSTDVGKIISQNGLTAKGKGSGIYTIKVTFTNGNVTCETEASIEYIAPDVLAGNIDSIGKITCRNDSLVLKTNMTSGSGLYTYKWSPDTSILKGQNTDSVFINIAKKYTVTVTDQSSGCTLVLDFDVKADTLKPLAEIKGDTLLDCRKSKVFLNSTQTDSTKYSIKWITPDQSVVLNRSSILNTLSGIYKLIIENNNNHCKDSSQWKVAIDTLHPKVELGADLNIDCKNDSVNITNLLMNPSGTISYYWTIYNTSLNRDTILQNKTIDKASRILLRLVNETNGCEASDSLTITDSRAIPMLNAGISEMLTCTRKSFQLHANVNPNDSLIISWSSAFGNIVSGINTLQPVVDKKAWYVIHIKNKTNACENLDSVFVDENIVTPNAVLGADLTFSCVDTVKTIDGSNSSSGVNILYQWSSPNGIIKSGNGNSKIIVSATGSYQLIVVDTLNGCRDTAVIKVNADQNKPIVAIANPDTISCLHTDVLLSATANSQSGNQLDFQWTNSSGNPIQSPKSLQTAITIPGIYIFTATDQSNGCSASMQIIVAIDTLKPVIDAGFDQTWNCASTMINLNGIVLINTGVYSYNWFTNNGLITSDPNKKDIVIRSPGTYFFLVIDEINACASFDSLNVISDLLQPIIQIQIPDTLNCIKNNITIKTQGSSLGIRYNYLWNTINGNIISNKNLNSVQVDKPGLYKFFITDTINKCNLSDSVLVFEDITTPVVNIQTPLKLTCNRKLITIDAMITNIGQNYLAIWNTSNGNIISPNNSLQCSVNKAGNYFIKIQNKDNGCETSDSIDVLENTNIPTDFHFNVAQPKCTGDEGTIDILDIVGGEKPLTYFLDNVPVNGSSFQNLAPGLRSIRIVDANGCMFSKNILINIPSSVGVTLPPLVKINFGENYTIIPVFSIPLDSIDWILWSPVDNLSCSDCPEPTILKLDKETIYNISYANKQGCIASASIKLEIIKRGIWVPNSFSPNGDNINDSFYPYVVEDSYKSIRAMSVYDRWGEQVFHKENFQANDPTQGWNGTFKSEKLIPGVYVYIIEVEWKNGELQLLKGDVSLIR